MNNVGAGVRAPMMKESRGFITLSGTVGEHTVSRVVEFDAKCDLETFRSRLQEANNAIVKLLTEGMRA